MADEVAVQLEGDKPKKSRKRRLPKILKRHEINRLFDAVTVVNGRRGEGYATRDTAILMLLYRSGLRVSEVCNLELRDLDLQGGSVDIYDGKGGDGTAYFDPDTVRPVLKAWLDIRSDWASPLERRLFVNHLAKPVNPRYLQRLMTDLAKEAGIESKCTPHVLRHTYATELLRDGFDLREVQTALRHANVATTEIYTHIVDEDLRRKMARRGRIPTTEGDS